MWSVFVYRLIIAGGACQIPVWVTGISGTAWETDHGLEKAERKGRKGAGEDLQKRIYWTVWEAHGIIEKGILGTNLIMHLGE